MKQKLLSEINTNIPKTVPDSEVINLSPSSTVTLPIFVREITYQKLL